MLVSCLVSLVGASYSISKLGNSQSAKSSAKTVGTVLVCLGGVLLCFDLLAWQKLPSNSSSHFVF